MRWLVVLVAMLGAAACAGPAASGGAQHVPFRYERNQILIETRVGASGPLTFLVDTGVTPSAIDTEMARTLGLALDESNAQPAGGAGANTVYIYPTRLEALSIDAVGYGDIDAVAFPTARLSRRLGEPLHGILGDSFLDGRVVTIDYARRTLTIGGAAPDASAPGVYQFPLVTAPNDIMPLMEVRVGGRPLTVSMDTGSSLGLEIYDGALDAAGLRETVADWQIGEAEGARGAFETRSGALPTVSVGPFELTGVRGTTSVRENEQYRQGNAGNALFQHFVVTFDYVGRTVTLRRAAD